MPSAVTCNNVIANMTNWFIVFISVAVSVPVRSTSSASRRCKLTWKTLTFSPNQHVAPEISGREQRQSDWFRFRVEIIIKSDQLVWPCQSPAHRPNRLKIRTNPSYRESCANLYSGTRVISGNGGDARYTMCLCIEDINVCRWSVHKFLEMP